MIETQIIRKKDQEKTIEKSCFYCRKRTVCKLFTKIDSSIDYLIIGGFVPEFVRYEIQKIIGENCHEYEN